MRSWIKQLEEAGELIRIVKPVDPHTQMGALLYQSRERGLLFENLNGFPGWRSLGMAPANLRWSPPGPSKKLLRKEMKSI
jgi:UbiD family decarboxylase